MKKITLQFSDLLHLLEFMAITHQHDCPIDTEKRIIVCELSEADIELAQQAYHATIISD
ncbi:MAG TPA: hypothetical protein VMR70_07790 [Flavisolibacter sp.]|nr:hypothetical protein [Flavisolibacter sp.]